MALNTNAAASGKAAQEPNDIISLPGGYFGHEDKLNSAGTGLISQVDPAHAQLPQLGDLISLLRGGVQQHQANATARPQPYAKVNTCFVSWQAESNAGADGKARTAARDELRDVFKNGYKYAVHDIRLPSSDAAARELEHGVYAQVRELQKQGPGASSQQTEGSLLVLHYLGDSAYRRSDKRGVWVDRLVAGHSAVAWQEVTECVRLASCDVLLILDCGFAHSVVPQDVEWNCRCEVLGSREGQATGGFTKELASILKASLGRPIATTELAWKLSRGPSFGDFGPRPLRLWSPLAAGASAVPVIVLHALGATFPQTTPSADQATADGYSRVILGVRLANPTESLVLQQWQHWVAESSRTVAAGNLTVDKQLLASVRLHCLVEGNPATGIVSMPAWLWELLGPHPAWTFISSTASDPNPSPVPIPPTPQIGPAPPDPPAYSEHPAPAKPVNGDARPLVPDDAAKDGPSSGSGKEKTPQSLGQVDRNNVEALFASALASAQLRVGESKAKRLEDFLKPPLRSVEDLLGVIDSQNDKFTNFREKRKPLFDAILAACMPLETVGEALAGAASEAFPPAQNVFAAVMYLINAAKDVSQVYDSIIELFVQLSDFTNRLKFYMSERLSPELYNKVSEILATVFEALVLAASEVRRGRLKAYFKRLFGHESPIPEVMQRLAALTEAEEKLVMAETNAGVKRSLSNQDKLLEIISRVDVNIQTIRAETRHVPQTREQALSTNRTKLKGILRPSAYAQDIYLGLSRTRTTGTGDWLLEDASLKAWISGDIRFLWICGNPGSGKSYLTSRLVSWGLNLLEEQDETHMLGYFFFKQNNPETRSFIQALRDMAFQICEQDVFYGKQVLQGVSSNDDIKTVSSAFRHLLIEPIVPDRWKRHIYVLLDGVDEADPQELAEFLSLLDDLNKQTPINTRVQVAMVGRTSLSEAVIERFENDSTSGRAYRTIHITPERNAADITSYISEGVYSSRILRGTSDDFKNQVIEVMKDQVDGLFILAKFMLAELNRARHPRRIIDGLRSYPKEITGMLRKTVLNFSETLTADDAADLNEILCWVSVAQMALTLEQIESILTLKVGDPPYRLEETLRGQQSCFFTLERADGLSTADLAERTNDEIRRQAQGALQKSPSLDGDGAALAGRVLAADHDIEYVSNKRTTLVTFCHASVREFFLSDDSTNLHAGEGSQNIGFDLAEARLHVLETCLRIFTDSEFFTAVGEDGISLQRYAAWYWQEHLQEVDRASLTVTQKAAIGRMIYAMLNEELVILAWTNLFEESLDIWTDSNIDCVRQWLGDQEVVAHYSANERSWADAASKSQVALLEPMGRIYARAWLQDGFVTYMPTLFCFGVVQTLALMTEDPSGLWSFSEQHWEDITLESRIAKATNWAARHLDASWNRSGAPTTKSGDPAMDGHWYRRIGSTFLNFGLHHRALQYFQTALTTDGSVIQNCGRIGVCHAANGNYETALRLHLIAETVEIHELSIALNIDLFDPKKLTPSSSFNSNAGSAAAVLTVSESFSSTTSSRENRERYQEIEGAKWRLYQNQRQIAGCYDKMGDISQALVYARRATSDIFRNQHPDFEPEAAYARLLAENGRIAELMTLFHELDTRQTARHGTGQSRFISFLLSQLPDLTVSLWLPEAAARTEQTEHLARRYTSAIAAAIEAQDYWKELYLRNCLGSVYLCSQPHHDRAISLHEGLLFSGLFKPQKGTLAVRAEHVSTFAQLSRAYFVKALAADPALLDETKIAPWLAKLEMLMAKRQDLFKDSNDGARLRAAGLDFNEASIYLILLYRLHARKEGQEAKAAKSKDLVSARVVECLELLEDEEPENDIVAVQNLQRTLLAAGDDANTTALWQSIRRPVGAGENTDDTMDPSRVVVSPERGGRRDKSKAKASPSPTSGQSKTSGNSSPGSSTPGPSNMKGRVSPSLGSTPGAGGRGPRRVESSPSIATPHLATTRSSERRTSDASGGSSPSFSPSPRRRGRDLVLSQVFEPGWSSSYYSGGEDLGGLLGAHGTAGLLVCDHCLRRLAPEVEFVVCKLCIDSKACQECLVALRARAGQPPSPGHVYSACNPAHQWLTIPPLKRRLQAGEILVEGQVMKLDEWKAGLRLKRVASRTIQQPEPVSGLAITLNQS
ncbi:NACHT and TPR domain-containing protein [Magnaporthiopsis poae ATCC 64411]|uniref:NACHT and TPR domain-containing protein n=1 Tax=Magnaporthiopsis poae (strain ATCC 64411 / 73-15) TaxID=644358 RepID=A0A0C4DN87_MAGP6|nr:NACHT and TPR domain-containing protein [Magnaporthiopsis poae ATCC 64411]